MSISQANVPSGPKTSNNWLQNIVETPPVGVEPPNIVTADGLALPYNASRRYVTRFLQNVGTAPVLVSVGDGPGVDSHHFILAKGTADNDGLGGQVDLSRIAGPIYVASADGNAIRVATMQTYHGQ